LHLSFAFLLPLLQVAAEELFDRPLVIYNGEDFANTGQLVGRGIHFSGELPALPGVTPLRLAYHGNAHYNSVVPSGPDKVVVLHKEQEDALASAGGGGKAGEPRDAVAPPLGRRRTRVLW
jgi:hypothetical protein